MSALAAATRPTRRDARRRPWSIVVAILMIALPVAGLSALWTWAMANENAVSVPTGGAVAVAELPRGGCAGQCPGQNELEDVLPGDFSATLVIDDAWGQLSGTSITSTGITQLPGHMLPEGATSASGAPLGPGEVLLPVSALEYSGTSLGETVTLRLGDTDHELTVAGTVPGYTGLVTGETLIGPDDPAPVAYANVSWHLSGPHELTAEERTELADAGFSLRSSNGLREQLGRFFTGSLPTSAYIMTVISGASTAAIGLLVVMLIMAPVFSITAARQTRTFALMRTQGATRGHIVTAVLAYGAIAGVLGATLGIAVGSIGAAISFAVQYPGWPITLYWWTLVLLWVITVAVAIVGAAFPAIRAANAPVTAGLEGVVGDRMLGWRRWMAGGPVTLAIIATFWVIARLRAPGTDSTVLGSGFVPLVLLLALIALVASIPACMYAATALTDRLSLAWRLAGRGSRRQALVSLPSLAAVVGVVFVFSFFMAVEGTESATRNDPVDQAHPPTVASMAAQYGATLTEEESQQAADLVLEHIGPGRAFPLTEFAPTQAGQQADTGDTYITAGFEELEQCYAMVEYGTTSAEYQAAAQDSELAALCLPVLRQTTALSPLAYSSASLLLATPDILATLRWDSEEARAQAEELLNEDAVLVSRDYAAHDDTMTMTLSVGDSTTGRILSEEAHAVPVRPILPQALGSLRLITPSLAEELGLSPSSGGTAFITDNPITSAESNAAAGALRESGLAANFSGTVGWGITPAGRWVVAGMLGLGVIVLGAFITILSAPRQRAQLQMLGVLGAKPALPARVAALTAALVAFLGSAIGLFGGHLAALAGSPSGLVDANGEVLIASQLAHFQISWEQVITLLIVAPLVSGLIAWGVHRRSGDPQAMGRRED